MILMTSHKCDVGKQHVTTVHRSPNLLSRDNLLEPSYLVLNTCELEWDTLDSENIGTWL